MSIESKQARAPTVLGDGNIFRATMINLKDEPLFAKLFQGFEVDTDKSYSIPWRFTQYAISGPNQRTSVTWKPVEYAWVWGTGLDSNEFVLAAYTKCKLGDKAVLSYDTTKNIAILTSTTPANPNDKLTVDVAPGFPAGWYVGFGIIDQDGQPHPLGVVDARSGMITTLTPKYDYSVAFVELVNNGMFSAEAVSELEKFTFTGTDYNHATCTFNTDGTWSVAYSSDAGVDN